MTLREALVAVRELLADESRWTKGALARDLRGRAVRPEDTRASQWCIYGAAMHVCSEKATRSEALNAFRGSSRKSLLALNDRSTHAEVLARLDAAIERCGG